MHTRGAQKQNGFNDDEDKNAHTLACQSINMRIHGSGARVLFTLHHMRATLMLRHACGVKSLRVGGPTRAQQIASKNCDRARTLSARYGKRVNSGVRGLHLRGSITPHSVVVDAIYLLRLADDAETSTRSA